jgi:hypothetical protein
VLEAPESSTAVPDAAEDEVGTRGDEQLVLLLRRCILFDEAVSEEREEEEEEEESGGTSLATVNGGESGDGWTARPGGTAIDIGCDWFFSVCVGGYCLNAGKDLIVKFSGAGI